MGESVQRTRPRQGKGIIVRGQITSRTLRRTRKRVWDVVVELPRDGEGKRHRFVRRGFATKREAEAKVASVLDSLGRGSFVEPDRITTGQYLVTWVDGLINLKASTPMSYATRATTWRTTSPATRGDPAAKTRAGTCACSGDKAWRAGAESGDGPTRSRDAAPSSRRCGRGPQDCREPGQPRPRQASASRTPRYAPMVARRARCVSGSHKRPPALCGFLAAGRDRDETR